MVQYVPKVMVLLAPGFEEVEALTPVDYLRRVDIDVHTVAVNETADSGKTVIGSHKIPVIADTTYDELQKAGQLKPGSWDAVILPGGMPGASNLAFAAWVGDFLKAAAEERKWLCAICAAPALVLAPLGLLEGRKFTCYPGLEEKVKGAVWCEDRVVTDCNAPDKDPAKNYPTSGGIITSRGAGTAGEFSLAIITKLLFDNDAKMLAQKILLK